jgi:hypothetical protein
MCANGPAGYLRINFDSMVGNMPIHISAGVRDEYTKLTSGAIGRNPVTLVTVPTDPTLISVGSYTPDQLITRETSYNYAAEPGREAGSDAEAAAALRRFAHPDPAGAERPQPHDHSGSCGQPRGIGRQCQPQALPGR